jgi:hypothetical protein
MEIRRRIAGRLHDTQQAQRHAVPRERRSDARIDIGGQ